MAIEDKLQDVIITGFDHHMKKIPASGKRFLNNCLIRIFLHIYHYIYI